MSGRARRQYSSELRILEAVHVVGNALLLWGGYYWLGIGESRAGTLAWSAVVAAALLGLTCWLHGGTFAYFAASGEAGGESGGDLGGVEEPPLAPVFRAALRNLAPLVLTAIMALALYGALARWADYSGQPAFHLASYLTLKFRKPVRPATVLHIFNAALWLVRWMAAPALLLPVIPAIATRGWRGFGAFGRHVGNRLYWLQTPLLLVCALWLPFQLMAWVPRPENFVLQMLSFALRLIVAYVLFLSGWLLLAYVTAGGRRVWSRAGAVAAR